MSFFLDSFSSYLRAWYLFFKKRLFFIFSLLEGTKTTTAQLLYRQRGRFSRPVSHFSIGILVILVIALSPFVSLEKKEEGDGNQVLGIMDANIEVMGMEPMETSNLQYRGGVMDYEVKEGDTVSSIAQKFGISIDTIRWANNLKSINDIKPGQKLKILPISGVLHTVRRGETVYSIAKMYGVSPQAIVDFPFNTFINDETFALAVGQELVVPGGVITKAKPWSSPSKEKAKTEVASLPASALPGDQQFIWPTHGAITQGFSWYHRAIDIADPAAPPIVAAQGGRVIVAGWTGVRAYGIHVIIDHGNGYKTLYAHLSSLNVSVGQQVLRGQVIGRMGSTGRSTGTHLHFELRTPKGNVNPLGYLR